MKLDSQTVKIRQAYDLETKIMLTKQRIHQWYELNAGRVYVAFSGGKDSTVLLHLVRSLYPDVPAVFYNTGCEFPEILKFVRQTENVVYLRPKMNIKQVLDKYGYPVISKEVSDSIYRIRNGCESSKNLRLYGKLNERTGNINRKMSEKYRYLIEAPFKISDKCCDVMKKYPAKKYEKETGRLPIIGVMASESRRRKDTYIRYGCNVEGSSSKPMAFWLEKDIWDYIHKFNVPYSTIYDLGYTRTGCFPCIFGIQHEGQNNRYRRMLKTHPKLYNYCINTLGFGAVLDFIGVPYRNEMNQLEFDWGNGGRVLCETCKNTGIYIQESEA